jgi:hypothetical protein
MGTRIAFDRLIFSDLLGCVVGVKDSFGFYDFSEFSSKTK